jgi:1,6-anhydro-N-acetylmuramate kinase
MELSIPGALVGGFVATLVMTMMMRLAGAAGITQMPPMQLVTGSMVSMGPVHLDCAIAARNGRTTEADQCR